MYFCVWQRLLTYPNVMEILICDCNYPSWSSFCSGFILFLRRKLSTAASNRVFLFNFSARGWFFAERSSFWPSKWRNILRTSKLNTSPNAICITMLEVNVWDSLSLSSRSPFYYDLVTHFSWLWTFLKTFLWTAFW